MGAGSYKSGGSGIERPEAYPTQGLGFSKSGADKDPGDTWG